MKERSENTILIESRKSLNLPCLLMFPHNQRRTSESSWTICWHENGGRDPRQRKFSMSRIRLGKSRRKYFSKRKTVRNSAIRLGCMLIVKAGKPQNGRDIGYSLPYIANPSNQCKTLITFAAINPQSDEDLKTSPPYQCACFASAPQDVEWAFLVDSTAL
jgi:hypothetical protein